MEEDARLKFLQTELNWTLVKPATLTTYQNEIKTLSTNELSLSRQNTRSAQNLNEDTKLHLHTFHYNKENDSDLNRFNSTANLTAQTMKHLREMSPSSSK